MILVYNPQLETFIRVADAGSFNKAAEQSYITPTAVIKQINLLEADLDVKLFERTHRGLTLTKAGMSLYNDAKYIISYCRDSVTRYSMTETVETIGKRNSVTIEEHYLKQREALNTALPIGVRQVETMRTMLTQSLAVLMPFNVQELNDKGGCYYGINQVSKNINIGNRKKLINGNGFVFGVPGSGKSFFCKMEMGNVFLGSKDEIIVIDPMNEYFDIAHTFDGAVVNMSTYTDNYVNPLDMDVWSLDLNDSKGMIREKGEFMLGTV